MSANAVERGIRGNCAVCNRRCGLYVCLGCALNSDYFALNRAEIKSSTPSSVSRMQQRSIEHDVAYDHWIAMIRHYGTDAYAAEAVLSQECVNDGFSYLQNACRLTKHNTAAIFTRQEKERWNDILNKLDPRPSLITAKRRAGLARRRWTRFCEVWARIGLDAWTAMIALPKPKRRSKPRFDLLGIE
jgi:hypothetical protein